MKRHRYDKGALAEAARSCTSMRQVLKRFHVAPYGGNYGVLRRALTRFGIDTSHFTGRAWNRGLRTGTRTSISLYLTNAFPIQSFKLKRRLLRERVLERRCSRCGLTDWQGEPIPLELDHIDGNNSDNRLENLRLLCPNCHALTPTYRSKRRPKA